MKFDLESLFYHLNKSKIISSEMIRINNNSKQLNIKQQPFTKLLPLLPWNTSFAKLLFPVNFPNDFQILFFLFFLTLTSKCNLLIKYKHYF